MSTPLHVTMGRLAAPVDANDHIRGEWRAPVTLVEYGDYQCPYCRAAHPVVQDLLRLRARAVRVVYRHFPLTNVHPRAEPAAELAEAAGVHGQFWPTHDWLFVNQDRLGDEFVAEAIRAIGLPDSVARDIEEHRHLDRVQRDFVSGIRSGVNGTPTFFVNDIRHDGGYGLAELLAAVDSATPAPGSPRV
jgi:protein-disulfide isomerase